MANGKNIKRALISSAIALTLSCSMLVGTTFAWFTDSVTSNGNIIQTGNLKVGMKWADGAQDPENVTWTDALEGPIFNYSKWEPGYVAARHIQIVNEGTLAFNYDLRIVPNGTVSELADVIDVYYISEAQQVETRFDIPTDNYVGTLNYVIENGIAAGELEETESYTATIVLKMREEAGNEYMGKSVSGGFSVQVVATQATYEKDSIDDQYDKDALNCDVLATPKTIKAILAEAKEGTIIGLADGYYEEITLTQDNLTLVAATSKTVVGFVNLNAKDGATLDNLTFDASGAKATYTFATGNVQTATGYVANITGDTNSPKAADNVVIKNCTFTNVYGVATAAETNYAPIDFEEQGAATERASDITVKNCTFACNALNYVRLNNLSEGAVVIADNTFGGGAYGTSHNTINATSNSANWIITGNSFNNWNTEKTAIGSSRSTTGEKVTWTITDNDFKNDDNAVVLALKPSYTADNSVVTLKDNTVWEGNGTIVPTEQNAEAETVYAGHKIQLNSNVKVVNDNDELKDAIKDNATVCLTAGEYTLPTLAGTEGVTIIGAEGTVISDEKGDNGFNNKNFGKDTTIKNVTFSGSTNGVRYSYANGGTSKFENCTFAGDSTYGFHVDQSNGATFIFDDCTFIGFNAFARDLQEVVFNNCTFLSNGRYGHTNIWSVGKFNNCTWGDNTSVSQGYNTSEKKYYGTLYFNGVEESYHHGFIGSAETLVALGGTNINGTYVLMADLDMTGKEMKSMVVPGGAEVNFVGNGHTISNLTLGAAGNFGMTGENEVAGLFDLSAPSVTVSLTVSDLTIKDATVACSKYAAVIVGYTSNVSVITLNNVDVIGAKITAETVAALVGYTVGEVNLTGCDVSGLTLTGEKPEKVGAWVGTANTANCVVTATNCTNSTTCNNYGRVINGATAN